VNQCPLRIGLLGWSDIAARKIVPALSRSGNATLQVIGSRNPGKVREGYFGLAAVMGYDELLQSADVDLVYISLPNHLHEEWTMRALAAGKHVICEKPLGLDYPSVRRMLDGAAVHKRLLYENIMYLHHPQHGAVRQLIAAGEIGRIISLRAIFGIPRLAESNFRTDPARGGGAFHDLARYPLSLAMYYLQGHLEEFNGIATDQGELNTGMYGVARSTAGELFIFAIAIGQQYESFYEIIGETGKIRVDRAFTTPADLENVVVLTNGKGVQEIRVAAADHFQLMFDQLSDRIRLGDFTKLHQWTDNLAQLAEAMEKGCRG